MRQMLERLQRGPAFGDGDLLPFRPFAPRPGRLGVMVEPLHPALRAQLDIPETQGLLVREVVPDSPAARAGIKPYDVLLEIGGKAVPADPAAFVRWLAEQPAGKLGAVVVLRKGKKETLGQVELPEIPRRPLLPDLRRPLEQLPAGGIWLHVERSADGSFTVQYRESGQTIRIEGHEAAGKPNVSKIEITEGRETKTYKSLDEVPASLRDKVGKLLESALQGRFFVPERQPKRFD
jgi:membrane-associated protease RseP (regulator of RpoE activity)